jgi:hypothetical protein
MALSANDIEAWSRREIAERAARIATMLDRWESEDVSGEPDWNVEDLEPVTLRRSADDRDRTGRRGVR